MKVGHGCHPGDRQMINLSKCSQDMASEVKRGFTCPNVYTLQRLAPNSDTSHARPGRALVPLYSLALSMTLSVLPLTIVTDEFSSQGASVIHHQSVDK